MIMTAKKVPNWTGEDLTFIYFVRSGEYIKIGKSKVWRTRVTNMQVGSPHTIIVLLVLISEPKLERQLHKRFRADHFRGEWFHSSPAILAYISENLWKCAKRGERDLRYATPVKVAKPDKNLAHGWDDL
jgi:hypothetical protein